MIKTMSEPRHSKERKTQSVISVDMVAGVGGAVCVHAEAREVHWVFCSIVSILLL